VVVNAHFGSFAKLVKREHPSPTLRMRYAVPCICAILLSIAATDFKTPADVNISLFYAAALFACCWSYSRPLMWVTACAAIILTYLGALLGPPPHLGVPMSVIWTNRTISGMTILATAVLGGAWIGKAKSDTERHYLAHQLAEALDLSQAIIRRANGEILFWSRGAEKLYGWSPEEATGRISHQLLQTQFPESIDEIAAAISHRLRWSGDLRHIRKDGIAIWVASSWAMVDGTSGPFGGIIIEVNNDITPLKLAESALIASQQRFRRLSEADVVGIVIADHERILEANDHFLRMLGYSRDDLPTLTLQQLIPPDEVQKNLARLPQLESFGTSPAVETEYVAKSGSRVPVLTGCVALDKSYLYFVIDQTERRLLQAQLMQAQKLDSIGKLAGGIAHDFNNILTIIIGNAELILDKMEEGNPLRKRVLTISNAADRGAALTRQLLTFSRHQPSSEEEVSLNELVRDAEGIMRQLIRENIRLVLSLGPEAGIIRASRSQMDQVLFNLVVNARDAMPDGGELLIETTEFLIESEYAASHLKIKLGRYALLTVSDTGVGMPEDVKKHLFEPFFTTKAPGKGTGLGLSTVYGAVMKMQGAISVYSEAGQGTVFKLLFPRVLTPLSKAHIEEGTRKPKLGAGTVLVAEDEPELLEYIKEMLEDGGYTVLQAVNGREALQITRLHPSPIDLLLTDSIMPEVGGDELASVFTTLRPGVPILRMSGYTDRLRHETGPGSQYIQKPFTPTALLDAIQQLLEM
jgi:PAS domain S-box-containing protein